MRVRATGQTHPALWGMVALLMLVGAVVAIALVTPHILRDWRISRDPVEVANATIHGECRTSRIVLKTCKARIAYLVDGRRFAHAVEFDYIDIDPSPDTAGVVRSASDPSLATLDVAVRKLWHQIIYEGALLGLLASGFVASFVKLIRSARLRRAFKALDGTMLRPVPVEVTAVNRGGYLFSTVTYLYRRDPPRTLSTSMGRKPEPFYLTDDPADSTALAVTDAKGEIALLLDEALTRLDFTEAERAALRAARAGLAARAA